MNTLPTSDGGLSRTTNSLERALGVLCFNIATFREIAANPQRMPGALAVVLVVSAIVGMFSGLIYSSPVINGWQLLPGVPHGLALAVNYALGWGAGWIFGATTGTIFVRLLGRHLGLPVFLRVFGYCFLFGIFWLMPALGILIVPAGCLIALLLAMRSSADLNAWQALLVATAAWGTALLIASAIQSALSTVFLPLLLVRWGVPAV